MSMMGKSVSKTPLMYSFIDLFFPVPMKTPRLTFKSFKYRQMGDPAHFVTSQIPHQTWLVISVRNNNRHYNLLLLCIANWLPVPSLAKFVVCTQPFIASRHNLISYGNYSVIGTVRLDINWWDGGSAPPVRDNVGQVRAGRGRPRRWWSAHSVERNFVVGDSSGACFFFALWSFTMRHA